jgi:hypothetical protein
MKPPGILTKLDDALNPIVVKELRQAVQSRFVVAVLLLFLALQLLVMGIFLIVNSIDGRLERSDFQAGRDVFALLQGVLLTTCMLFVPAYTGFRLAAEHSDTNTDLLFITTLPGRAIISGKFAAAVVLAVMIFSACTPFMAFTYFLRGIDLPSIFFVITLDFVVVLGSVMLTIFLAVIPGNRVLKALLGLVGLIVLLVVLFMTLSSTLMLLEFGVVGMFETREFWIVIACMSLGFAGLIALLYTWSVALVNPPSANRALPSRLMLTALWAVSGGLVWYFSRQLGHEGPLGSWVVCTVPLLALYVVIAINERERWTPRVARTIPRRWWLRVPAFLFYSGAAGGILHALLLFALTGVIVLLWFDGTWVSHGYGPMGPAGRGAPPYLRNYLLLSFEVVAMLFLYIYCYGLTAVALRRLLLPKEQAIFTWVVAAFLMAVGSAVPLLLAFLVHGSRWNFYSDYGWMLFNPIAGMIAAGEGATRPHVRDFFFLTVLVWAAVATLLNLPWFFRQMARFRPYVAGRTPAPVPAPVAVNAAPGDVTRSAT